ncbi:MAG: holo-ACP synthase [Bacteroidetes bacterium]|jgi:holo-[acyl-carrier protein] synthase|nr:holo-ACP synthase [Bacteroidota bacterium]MBU1422679.1 holo-ACP synthase [Bacteroidota bacterium]MBU2471738.1 holo-ACP synthase [Bacteroidota bacterium]MBU2637038.1 holo-ACP synthase [Bacteroidota bacterium]
MISGIGIDVVEIMRFKKSVNDYGNRFLEKVFTKTELQYAQSKKEFVQHLAARFAAKEAVAKAISTGWSSGFRWKDVEVTNDSSGKPAIILTGKMKELLTGQKVLISISHSESVVIAFVIIESMN